MTNQEIFDFVSAKLIEQGEPSIEGISCKYRLPKNGKMLKCAAGQLIPDEVYRPEFEGKTVTDELLKGIFENLGIDVYFLNNLQSIHDSSAIRDSYIDILKRKLIEFAEINKLEVNFNF